MDSDRSVVALAAAVILALTLASSPVFGIVTIPDDSPQRLGSGSATITIQSTPEEVTLEGGHYTDVHYLRVPEMSATVEDVSGSPVLTLSLAIRDIGYSRSSVYVLSEEMDGTHGFAIQEDSIDSAKLRNDSYRGRLQVVLRDESGRTELVNEPVAVEVKDD